MGGLAGELEQRAVLHLLCCTNVTKRELNQKAKLSIYWSIVVPTLTYGHEGWVVTERTILWVQEAQNGFSQEGGWCLS